MNPSDKYELNLHEGFFWANKFQFSTNGKFIFLQSIDAHSFSNSLRGYLVIRKSWGYCIFCVFYDQIFWSFLRGYKRPPPPPFPSFCLHLCILQREKQILRCRKLCKQKTCQNEKIIQPTDLLKSFNKSVTFNYFLNLRNTYFKNTN